MAEKEFSPSLFGTEAIFQLFYSSHKASAMRPRSFANIRSLLVEELNFGQEPVFLEVSIFKPIPGSFFLTTKLLSPPSSVWEVER